MNISEKQAQLLLQVLLDSLKIDSFVGNNFSSAHKIRAALYDEIINQQSRELKELG